MSIRPFCSICYSLFPPAALTSLWLTHLIFPSPLEFSKISSSNIHISPQTNCCCKSCLSRTTHVCKLSPIHKDKLSTHKKTTLLFLLLFIICVKRVNIISSSQNTHLVSAENSNQKEKNDFPGNVDYEPNLVLRVVVVVYLL